MLSARAEGQTLEARKAESGELRFLASEPPPHQLGALGEHCKLPQWGPENFEFRALWDLKMASKQCNLAMKLYERV